VRPAWRSAAGSLRNSPKRCVQNAPRVGLVVSDRAALDPGEVAAGVGLRPPLAPGLLARRHAPQDAVLLLLGAEFEDGGREQEDAVLCHPLRRARRVVLLLEDQPLPEGRLPAAVLAGPRHDGVARVEQGALPLEVRGEALTGVAGGQGGPGHVGLQPRAAVGAELLLGGAEREVHGRRDRSVASPETWMRRWQESSVSGHCCQPGGVAQ